MEIENQNDILNSQVLLIKYHVRTFFKVKPVIFNKLSDILNYLPSYINIPLADSWEKVNSVQQLHNKHM